MEAPDSLFPRVPSCCPPCPAQGQQGQNAPWDPDALSTAAATSPFLSLSLPYFLLASGNAWTQLLRGSSSVHPLSQATPPGAAVVSACSAEEGHGGARLVHAIPSDHTDALVAHFLL